MTTFSAGRYSKALNRVKHVKCVGCWCGRLMRSLGLPWLELFKALAPVATAIIAFLALKNWKRQEKAKRQADFLDQFTEAVHDFIGAMPTPVTRVEMIKIGMQSHIPMEPKNSEPAVAGAIEYIERRGNEDAKQLFEALEVARPAATRVRALT